MRGGLSTVPVQVGGRRVLGEPRARVQDVCDRAGRARPYGAG